MENEEDSLESYRQTSGSQKTEHHKTNPDLYNDFSIDSISEVNHTKKETAQFKKNNLMVIEDLD